MAFTFPVRISFFNEQNEALNGIFPSLQKGIWFDIPIVMLTNVVNLL